MTTVPRLDVLLYAHDGRGLGHVSRSAAIGSALRRLYPHLRVCLVTGCRQTQEMIDPAPLDWLKLPAYQTEIKDNVSHGIDGPSGFSDAELKTVRTEQLRQLVRQLRPRLILVDHSPQGKHKELLAALEETASTPATRWVLGIRGVVGGVPQTESPLARELFTRYYQALLWYGDSHVLGHEHRGQLARRFGGVAEECGYVSRLRELEYFLPEAVDQYKQYACTVSIPWFGPDTHAFAFNLLEAIRRIGPTYGQFSIFIGMGASVRLLAQLRGVAFCSVASFGSGYGRSLRASKTAVIFGGYNSLVDVLGIGVPALVVLRDMHDLEQQQHCAALAGPVAERLTVVEEKSCGSGQLFEALSAYLEHDGRTTAPLPIKLDGASRAAKLLAESL